MSSLHSYPSGGLFSPRDVPSLKLGPALVPNRHRGNCSNMPGLRVGRGVASWRITLTSLEVKDFIIKKMTFAIHPIKEQTYTKNFNDGRFYSLSGTGGLG